VLCNIGVRFLKACHWQETFPESGTTFLLLRNFAETSPKMSVGA
jgi:hypothetical protein